MKHYTHPYLLNPVHQLQIVVVGAGGTGSQLMQKLGRINYALQQLGHMGLHVNLYDNDLVSPANCGRQLFAESDIGCNKAEMLIGRINRFYNTTWNGIPERYEKKATKQVSHIIISCVDTVKSRYEIMQTAKKVVTKSIATEYMNFYWMDIGNSQKYGQIVLGSWFGIPQPDTSESHLANFFDLFPDITDDKTKGPSCSLAEALHTQDLFINSLLAEYAGNMLWKMFRQTGLNYNYLSLNIDLMAIHTELKLKENAETKILSRKTDTREKHQLH